MMSLNEAVKAWKQMERMTTHERLQDPAYHESFHEVVAVIRPAVLSGAISLDALSEVR